MSTPTARKPRPSDVARWVAILAAPLPPMRDGAAYRDALHARTRAGNGLMAAGLDNTGASAAETPAERDAATALAYAERSIAEEGDPWQLAQGVPVGRGAAPLSGPCVEGVL